MESNKIVPRIGYVILEDITEKAKPTAKFGEVRHEQPSLARVVSVAKEENGLIPFDPRIVADAVVLKPVAQKQEFPSGDGRKLYMCHHSDIKVFFKLA